MPSTAPPANPARTDVATANVVVRVQSEDFDVGREMTALYAAGSEVGAVASFVGLVRAGAAAPDAVMASSSDSTQTGAAAGVATLELEHYPGMTEASIQAIIHDAQARWPLAAVTVIHRVGVLAPGAQIVLVLTASAHRGAAFEACEFIMDYLKTRAVFWKRERKVDGSHVWVQSTDADRQEASSW